MTKELEANISLSHYRIVSKLGAGGMGEVYLAQDTKLNRKVALKILPPELAANRDRMRRFVQEAQAAAALNHPNIAHIYEIGESDDTNFIAMEFVDGVTLRAKIHDERSDLRTLLKHLLQVADGLAKAHGAGIVHRDLKPDNIMITVDGHAKVLDFGLAKLLETRPENGDETGEAATAMMPVQHSTPGMVMGTVGYMSPEQAKAKAVDQRSDIFSFGCILYEATSGRKPFIGDSVVDTLHKIIHDPAPAITGFNPSAPHELQRVIRKCLAKEPAKRYQTIRDTANDLEELLDEMKGMSNLERSVAPSTSAGTSIGPGGTDQYVRAETTSSVTHSPSSSAEYIVSEFKRHKLVVAIALVLLVSGAAGLSLYMNSGKTATAIDSIAVLPFQNRSSDADTEYLSDGLAESLIYRLSQLPNLKVSSTSAVMRYKGKELDAQKIAAELGVRAVMSGRMIQRGENISISVELVDGANNKIIWGEQYERKMSDLLAMQREIATTITEKLQVKLSGEVREGISKQYTENSEAYQLYLKGRFQWNKRTIESLKQAVEYYNQAIGKDPGFALAYSGLAETYALFPNYDVASAKDSMPQAKAAALRALELDDTLAEAHTALGWYFFTFEFDWAAGERELRRAIELNPKYATAHQWLGELLAQTKRFDEAHVEVRRALEADPLSPVVSFNLGWVHFLARNYDEAIKEFERTAAIYPDFAIATGGLCWTYYVKGSFDQAIPPCRQTFQLLPDAFNKGYLSMVLGRAGQREEAKKLLDELRNESLRRDVPSMALAFAHLGLNEKQEALQMIEKEVDERGYWASTLAVTPEVDELRSEPRFKTLIKRMNLPE